MDIEIINNAIDHFGRESQISKAIEEMAELTSELARAQNNRGMNVNLIEEIADVSIMIAQLREIFGPDLVDCHIEIKLRRLKGLLQDSLK
jgi:hypothetical protein